MSERVGIHLSTNEWVEIEVEDWDATQERAALALDDGRHIPFGEEVFNSFHIVSVRRGGIPDGES